MSIGYLYIFFGSAEVENLLASAADASDLVSIPVLERCTEKEMVTTSVFLPEKFHEEKSLMAMGHKESDS